MASKLSTPLVYKKMSTISNLNLETSDGVVIPLTNQFKNVSSTILELTLDMEGMIDTNIPINVTKQQYDMVNDILTGIEFKTDLTKEDYTKHASLCAKYKLEEVYDLLEVSNFFGIRVVYDIVCNYIASLIKGKSTEEIRTFFNIENDLTPEEEEKIRQDTEWFVK